MRICLPGLSLVLPLVAAAPALAQTAPPLHGYGVQQEMLDNVRAAQLRAQLDLAARQSVYQQNEFFNLQSQFRAGQAIDRLNAQSVAPQVPPPLATTPPREIDVSGLASIPDAALAESDARVRAAAGNQR